MSSLKEELISFDTSKLAKEKGFNISTKFTFKSNGKKYEGTYFSGQPDIYYRPTQSLLQKWLREIHKIDVNVLPYSTRKKYWEVVVEGAGYTWSGYETYEEALEEGLQHALKLIQK